MTRMRMTNIAIPAAAPDGKPPVAAVVATRDSSPVQVNTYIHLHTESDALCWLHTP